MGRCAFLPHMDGLRLSGWEPISSAIFISQLVQSRLASPWRFYFSQIWNALVCMQFRKCGIKPRKMVCAIYDQCTNMNTFAIMSKQFKMNFGEIVHEMGQNVGSFKQCLFLLNIRVWCGGFKSGLLHFVLWRRQGSSGHGRCSIACQDEPGFFSCSISVILTIHFGVINCSFEKLKETRQDELDCWIFVS